MHKGSTTVKSQTTTIVKTNIPFIHYSSSKTLQLTLHSLFPPLQSRMLGNNRPCNRKKRGSTTLARELCLGTNMEERKVTSNKVVRDARSLV
jgi:hypothetical protein